MGCGYNKISTHINVDSSATCSPDLVFDLETLPWPWETSVAESVVFNHSLEHMGQDSRIFLGMMQELYRICKHRADVFVNVPHPRHDHFIGDPTHVRAITPSLLSLFDREKNDIWKRHGVANTPLAHYLGVNFKTVEVQAIPDEPYRTMFLEEKTSVDDLDKLSRELNNVLVEYRFRLVVFKESL